MTKPTLTIGEEVFISVYCLCLYQRVGVCMMPGNALVRCFCECVQECYSFSSEKVHAYASLFLANCLEAVKPKLNSDR